MWPLDQKHFHTALSEGKGNKGQERKTNVCYQKPCPWFPISWSCMISTELKTILLEHCNTLLHLNDQHGIFLCFKVQSWKRLKELKRRSVEEKNAGKILCWDCRTPLGGPIFSNRKKSLSNSKLIQSSMLVLHWAISMRHCLPSKLPRELMFKARRCHLKKVSENTWLFIFVTSSRARTMFFM